MSGEAMAAIVTAVAAQADRYAPALVERIGPRFEIRPDPALKGDEMEVKPR